MNSFIFQSLSKEYFLTLPVQVRVFDVPLCFMERESMFIYLLNFLLYIGVKPINKIVIVSGAQQCHSARQERAYLVAVRKI